MRIHSDVLERRDFTHALISAGLSEVWIADCSEHNSRKRKRGFEVRLAAKAGRDLNGKARRPRMNAPYGKDGSAPVKAATYDEHGWWIAELFKMDSEAIVGPYDGQEDFHAKTRYAYNVKV